MTAGSEAAAKLRQLVCMDLYEELAMRRTLLRGRERMEVAMQAADVVYVDGMTKAEWFNAAVERLP